MVSWKSEHNQLYLMHEGHLKFLKRSEITNTSINGGGGGEKGIQYWQML